MKTSYLMFVLLVPLLAHARLGESISDCDIRYGGGKPGLPSAEDRIKPLVTGENTTNLTYNYKGFAVRVGFHNSAAVRIDFTHTGTSKLSDGEIEQILEANRGELRWFETSAERAAGFVSDSATFARADKEMKAWRRIDETVAVVYNRGRSLRLVLREKDATGKAGNKKPADAKPGATTF